MTSQDWHPAETADTGSIISTCVVYVVVFKRACSCLCFQLLKWSGQHAWMVYGRKSIACWASIGLESFSTCLSFTDDGSWEPPQHLNKTFLWLMWTKCKQGFLCSVLVMLWAYCTKKCVSCSLTWWNIGRTDREQIHSRINNNWCRAFRPRRPLSSWQRPTWSKHPASVVIDSATYLLRISLPNIDNVAMSLYISDEICTMQ